MDKCTLNLQFHHFYKGPNKSLAYSGLELNSLMANHHASWAGNKIPHSLSKYAISHSGCCKNRVNLRRCICLDRKKNCPKDLQVLSFSCNFTSVATTKFSEHVLLSLTISMEHSSGWMHVLYISTLGLDTSCLFSFSHSMFQSVSTLCPTPWFHYSCGS